MEPCHVLETVQREKEKNPSSALVVLPHWNYEMELYPQPAHRQLAFAVIEAGADAVIGHHTHRVGGLEFHKGKMIGYSIGNWWLPHCVYFDGAVTYQEDACLQLALEWLPNQEVQAHWYKYRPDDHLLVYRNSEAVSKSVELQRRTPFAGMDHQTYCQWFQKHRIKKKMLPVYADYRQNYINRLKDRYVLLRHFGVEAIERTGLRKAIGL